MKPITPNLMAVGHEAEALGRKKQPWHFYAALALGALLAACVQFFPTAAIAYVLCPWIYLPCFLYASRKIENKKDLAVWLLFWCGSFEIRYWGLLQEFSLAASCALALIGAITYAIPFLMDRLTFGRRSRLVALLLFPFITASIDYMLELMTLGSLFSLAPTQFDNKPLLQIASVLGGKGITFVLALSASLLVYCRKNIKRIVICVLIILLIHGWGLARICVEKSDVDAAETVTIGWSGEPVTDDSFFSDDSDGSLAQNTEALERAVKAASEQGIEFLCFPEESFYVLWDYYEEFADYAMDLAEQYHMNLLLPTEVGDIRDDDGEDVDLDSINLSLFIDSDGIPQFQYVKSKLIPLAEKPYYVDGNEQLPDVIAKIGDREVKLSYAICFDGDFASYVRTMPEDTELFIDTSWDWAQVDDLHYRIIGLRAVEDGITFVKPTVCGYTTVTDYLGRLCSITHSNDTGYSGVNVLSVPLAKCDTVYLRYGDKIDLCYFAGFAALLLLLLMTTIEGNGMETVKEKSKKPLTRFGEFEFLKALAIMGLPLVHVMEEAMEANMASPALKAFGTAIVGLCAFGPSVFMICMGFGIGGSRSSADSIRRTGIQFLLIGAILNIVRWLLPGIVQMLVVKTPLIEDVKFCLQSDIYYFAGIFFVFYSFMKQFKVTTPQLLLISIIALTVNDALTPIMQRFVTNSVVASLVGNIIYVNETSCFPLLSWMIFPTIGIIMGEVLKKNTDEFREVFMRRMLDFSLVFFGAFAFFIWNYDLDLLKILVSPANDYITDLPNVLLLVSLACFLIGLTYYLCKAIGHTKFMAFMLKISAFIIPFYLLQWVIISWIFYATNIFNVPLETFGPAAYAVTVVLVTALCIYVASEHGMKIMKVLVKFTYIKKKRKKKAVKKNEK